MIDEDNKNIKNIKNIKKRRDNINKKIDIINLLENGTREEIEKNILNEIYNLSSYCDTVIGQGAFGKISIPSLGETLQVRIEDDVVTIPIVTKKAMTKGDFFIDQLEDDDNTLVLNSDNNITCEALILHVLSKAWYKSLNIHLPFLIGFGICDNTVRGVSQIILEKCGLSKRIIVDRNSYFGNPFNLTISENIKKTFLTNVDGLIEYMMINKRIERDKLTNEKKIMCTLPNNENVEFVEIIDNICIFYLHTCYFLWERFGLTLGDQHTENIFVHWINRMSRCGKRKLNGLKYINYDTKNDRGHIKIDTHGMIFKIGDIGVSIMNIRKDVMIIGNLTNANNLGKAIKYKKKCYCYWDFIFDILKCCPKEIFDLTIINKIIQKHNISLKYIPFVGLDSKYINDFPDELSILNDPLYDYMRVSEYKNIEDIVGFTNYL